MTTKVFDWGIRIIPAISHQISKSDQLIIGIISFHLLKFLSLLLFHIHIVFVFIYFVFVILVFNILGFG